MAWRRLCVFVLTITAVAVARADEFPYTAYVNSDDVYVRSGPGRNYYPTEKLKKGDPVEVYRHDPGSWLAIRPTSASFAWVSQRHLDPTGDGLATVNSDRVVARVGSTFSEVRDVIQVRLERGEKVELLEAPRHDSPWCKIAPPAGEFRWVFSKYVDRDPSGEVAVDGDDESSERGVRPVNSESESEKAGGDPLDEVAGTSSPARLDPASSAARELAQLELELSTIVAQDVSAWSFDEIERRAKDMLQHAETPTERGHVRILLSRVERFADIQKRHEALRNGSGDGVAPASAAAPESDYRRAAVSQFDGVGRLSPVISEKVGGPQYALVDNANAVISFITPAPGVNLRPYIDHYVGVNGQRGYSTDLQRQHISVQRVTLLETARR